MEEGIPTVIPLALLGGVGLLALHFTAQEKAFGDATKEPAAIVVMDSSPHMVCTGGMPDGPYCSTSTSIRASWVSSTKLHCEDRFELSSDSLKPEPDIKYSAEIYKTSEGGGCYARLIAPTNG